MHATRQRGLRVLGALAVLTSTLAIGNELASAVNATGAFELDGNAVHSSTDDWDNVCHEVTITNDTDELIPDECATAGDTSGATAVEWANDGSPNATIFTGGGSKDAKTIASWSWKDNAGGLPDKDNLVHSFAARYTLPAAPACPGNPNKAGSPCELLFFGSDRFDNSGDAHQGFWFFQDAVGLGEGGKFQGEHRTGDLLIISGFSNGGTTSTISVYGWDPACTKASATCAEANLKILVPPTGANCASTPANAAFCGIVNPANGTAAPWSYTDKSGNSSYLQGELYEGGINLSLLGLSDRCFAAVASETRSSTSTTATLKDFVLGGFGSCDTKIETTPSAGKNGSVSIGTGSVAVTDAADLEVNGIAAWSGSLQFALCGPIATGTCTSGGTDVGDPVPVTEATAQPIESPEAIITSVGRYCWRATFTSATTGVPNKTDSASTECFTVTPVTPAIDTQAVDPEVDFGQAVQDNATLSGTATQPGSPVIEGPAGPAAGGTIRFTLLKADCSTLATGTGTNPQSLPVSGDDTYGPVSFTPDAPGTYHWKAQYIPADGDPNNVGSTHNAACNDTDERVVVNQAPTGITTRQFVYPQDKAEITATGGGNLAGSVKFKLYDTLANCTADGATGLLYDPAPIGISGPQPQSAKTSNATVAVTSSTTVYWRVTYTSTNPAQLGSSSVCEESTQVTYAGNDTGITVP